MMELLYIELVCNYVLINVETALYRIIIIITVKPRPKAHMDMILFEVFLKNMHLIPQDQIVQWHYL